MTDTEIRPYRIAVPQGDLDDLTARLEHIRWPDELPGAEWNYGVPVDYLQDLPIAGERPSTGGRSRRS